jgi:cell division protease FtsH
MKILFHIFLWVSVCSGFKFNSKWIVKNVQLNAYKKYPISQRYYEDNIKKLNSKNISVQNEEILGNDDLFSDSSEENVTEYRVIIDKNIFSGLFEQVEIEDDGDDYESYRHARKSKSKSKNKKSDNFEVISKNPVKFKDVGGYDSVKSELYQCIDLLQNYTKYSKFNVRVPKGLIFEGPPGNGKTLIAKALAGESKNAFIAVSGAEFQDKYVGVGSGKIRELFELAQKNIPCIIFIDEIDALGRSRGNDGQSSAVERDNTLNELLIALDGFKNSTGIFVIGATNRADLLDDALLRPGRIDKRIYIGNPDEKTRKAIIDIHIKGKPRTSDVLDEQLVDITSGFSGAQIENILNEAMLNALRCGREEFSYEDVDVVFNKMLAGWQPTDHKFTNDIIDHIAIHEMGHAIVGIFSKHHSKMSKVVINLSSPTSPAYTVFENSNSNIYTREALFEHLMILLSGRVAEEVFYGVSVTTGAINDFEEAYKLADKMITYYGLGEHIIYPSKSETYKEKIDNEISELIEDAYRYAEIIIDTSRELIHESAELLKEKKTVKADELIELMNTKYSHLSDIIFKK